MAERRRITAALDDDTFQQLEYWSQKKGINITDFVRDAIEFRIAFYNKDYPLAPMEVQRLNQLIDAVASMSSNVHSLERVVTSGFDSLLGLCKGDNNYLNEEDGELDA